MLKFLGPIAAAGLMLVAFGVNAASATAIAVQNFSFETPDEGVSGASNDSVANWTGSVGSPSSFLFGTYAPVNPTQYISNGLPTGNGLAAGQIVPDGKQAAFIAGTDTLSQNTAAIFADNTLYTLQVYIGNRRDTSFVTGGAIALTANGTVINAAKTSFTSTDDPDGKWVNLTVSYSTTTGAGDPFLGQTIGIALMDTDASHSDEVDFDNVRLDAISSCTAGAAACNGGGGGVPEPITLSIFGAGLAGIAAMRRRKARA
jgi:hypothetical protein